MELVFLSHQSQLFLILNLGLNVVVFHVFQLLLKRVSMALKLQAFLLVGSLQILKSLALAPLNFCDPSLKLPALVILLCGLELQLFIFLYEHLVLLLYGIHGTLVIIAGLLRELRFQLFVLLLYLMKLPVSRFESILS